VTKKPKVLVSDKLSDEGLQILSGSCDVVVKTGLKEPELVKEIPKYDALMVRSGTKVTAKIIAAAKNLKIVARAGVGVDNIDIAAATQAGIIVVNSPTGNILAAAELAMGHIFALARNIPQADRSMREGRWDRKLYMGSQLAEKTLGIVGFGKIGFLVGKAAAGVGMNILVYDPVVSEEHAKRVGGRLVSLDYLLRHSDYITLHVPKIPMTYHMIGEPQFKIVKKGVRIVNCSRGGIIDEAALAKALKSGKVAGAALDVFEKEPPEKSELFSIPNVVMTPHLGASTVEAQVSVAVDVARQVLDFFDGRFPSSAVNMPSVKPEILESHKPYFLLAEKIGGLLAGLLDSTMTSVSIRYEGKVAEMEMDLITRNLLVGLLHSRYEDVNVVNAPLMIKERGIEMEQSSSESRTRFNDLIVVEVKTKNSPHRVAGTLSIERLPRIVDIDGYAFDLAPEGMFLLVRHRDQPGMIGKVGTLMGNKDINIAGMQVGRESKRGNALMAILVDEEVSPEVMKSIKRFKGVTSTCMIRL